MKVSTSEAARILNQQSVVALPTETVYGLAAKVDCALAVDLIFATKKRPFFDPLIVHVQSIEQARTCVSEWSALAHCLAEEFWPGPLTLVLPKSIFISDRISSGLSTVGLRQPSHPLFLEVLQKLGSPLAAPSANRFGRTSPTCYEHVMAEFGEEFPCLDGGSSQHGIESTILEVDKNQLRILRPGPISRTRIETALEGHVFSWKTGVDRHSSVQAPGQLKHHYLPTKPLVILPEGTDVLSCAQEILQHLERHPPTWEGLALPRISKITGYSVLNLSEDPVLAARDLYSELRRKSEQVETDIVVFFQKPLHIKISERGEPESLWTAVWERLSKAALVHIKR